MNNLLSKGKNRPDSLFPVIAAVVILVTAAVYYQVRSFEFLNYDDTAYVTQNPVVQSGLNIDSIKWSFTTFLMGNWHPLTWLSLMLDYEFYGLNAGGFHITNLIFHLANTVLLFWLFLRMTNLLWPSAFIAALFALHPLHIESVAWVAERKDVLSTFFWFLTMLAYLRYTESKTNSRYAAIVILFILGLMAKPMLVTLPFVLLLMDYWPLNRLSKNTIIEKLPLFAISACSSVVTFFAQRSSDAISSTQLIPLQFRLGNALFSYESYLTKMFWPIRLAVFYPHPTDSLTTQRIAYAALNLAFICFLIIRFRRLKWLTTGWLWYLGTLVPVIGLVQIGSQAMADRYTYIPLIGIFVILGWAAYELLPPLKYRTLILAVSAIVILSALAARTYNQLGHWRNTVTLCEHSISVTKDNFILRYNLAIHLKKTGHPKEAIDQFLLCAKLVPSNPQTYQELGLLYHKQDDLENAVKYYTIATQINPDFFEAHNNLAVVLRRLGRPDEAIEHFKEALRLRPDEPSVMQNLQRALDSKDQLAK